jgi:hypothetical protein
MEFKNEFDEAQRQFMLIGYNYAYFLFEITLKSTKSYQLFTEFLDKIEFTPLLWINVIKCSFDDVLGINSAYDDSDSENSIDNESLCKNAEEAYNFF